MLLTVAALALVFLPKDPVSQLSPGDAIGLAPNPVTTLSRSKYPSGTFPRTPTGTPWSVPVAGLGFAGLAGSVMPRRRRNDDPLIVVVHGDGGSASDFDFLLETMGIAPDRVVAFDYSAGHGGVSSTDASHVVPTSTAADSLDALLRDLADEHSNIYTIHHSRGGAVGVEMIANMDEGRRAVIDGYQGAALLDPAIATGAIGALQSAGGRGTPWSSLIPDDGGFDPIRCDIDGCRDIRRNLGQAAGVEVVAVRNPDALVTNFIDQPEGLKVFDLDDGRGSALLYSFVSPILMFWRMTQAHGSVLASDKVASCVAAEIELPGSCTELDR